VCLWIAFVWGNFKRKNRLEDQKRCFDLLVKFKGYLCLFLVVSRSTQQVNGRATEKELGEPLFFSVSFTATHETIYHQYIPNRRTHTEKVSNTTRGCRLWDVKNSEEHRSETHFHTSKFVNFHKKKVCEISVKPKALHKTSAPTSQFCNFFILNLSSIILHVWFIIIINSLITNLVFFPL
jgi:hypothetical protein